MTKYTDPPICSGAGGNCPHPHLCNINHCPHWLLAPISLLHFVGFRNPVFHKDPHYANAVRAFGQPDVIHRVWDQRAKADIAPDDVAVFAKGDYDTPPTPYTYDDSHDDYIVAAGGDKDR